MVEEVLPVLQGLQAVHHGAIKPVRRVGDDENDNEDVEPSQIWPLPPLDTRKHPTRIEEVALRWHLGCSHRARGTSKVKAHDGR